MINMSDLVEDEKKKNTKICSTDTNEWKNYTHTHYTLQISCLKKPKHFSFDM